MIYRTAKIDCGSTIIFDSDFADGRLEVGMKAKVSSSGIEGEILHANDNSFSVVSDKSFVSEGYNKIIKGEVIKIY